MSSNSTGSFERALDYKGRATVKGLWVRNGRYYLQMRIPGSDGISKPRRVPLAAKSFEDAKKEVSRIKTERDTLGKVPLVGRKPTAAELIDRYLAFHVGSNAKRSSTIRGEKSSLKMWKEEVGGIRVDRLTKAIVLGVLEKRLKSGRSNRTVNLDLVEFRNVLKYGRDLDFLRWLPTDGIKSLKTTTPHRGTITPDQLQRICDASIRACPRTGPMLCDYVRFLAYSGAREQEGLRVKWEDVLFDRKQIVVGADGMAKNGRFRVVDMSPSLEQHLRTMYARRDAGSGYLFPSPRRKHGEPDRPAKRLRNALEQARSAAGLPRVGFHHFRRFFISYASMAGVPHLTIAKWVGHESGTALIDRVYAHPTPEHLQRAASLVSFINPARAYDTTPEAETGSPLARPNTPSLSHAPVAER